MDRLRIHIRSSSLSIKDSYCEVVMDWTSILEIPSATESLSSSK